MHKKDNTHKPNLIQELARLELFSSLNADQLQEIAATVEIKSLSRGEVLITEGELENSLFLVLSGRFEVSVGERENHCAEIGTGQVIGEISFITGQPRTATVKAIRESIVLVLSKADFEKICEKNPTIWQAISIVLAKRLAASNSGFDPVDKSIPSTITIIPAGAGRVPPEFIKNFISSFGKVGSTLLIRSDDVSKYVVGGVETKKAELIKSLNNLETKYDHIVYVSDPELTDWSKVAISQADLVLSVGVHAQAHDAAVPLNEIEQFTETLHDVRSTRLILLHPKKGVISGTSHWLDARNVAMHHHLCTDEQSDYARLVRFITGNAIGLVACGGGALCCSHLGLYKALTQSGIEFDMFGGTSGGSAMAATFALNFDPDVVERQTHNMFVTEKALGLYNFPVFSLLDHKNFDEQLKILFDTILIEDFWYPYFAVSADLSNGQPICIRRGSLWQAIRASSSLPALLPPFYTSDGRMLVDGGLIDNVPIRAMHDIKDGPNIVISFEDPRQVLFPVDYHDIPSRLGLMGMFLTRQQREKMQNTPRLIETLMRSLLANRQDFRAYMGQDDLLLSPNLPENVGLMDWRESLTLVNSSFKWAQQEITRLRSVDEPAISRIDALLKH